MASLTDIIQESEEVTPPTEQETTDATDNANEAATEDNTLEGTNNDFEPTPKKPAIETTEKDSEDTHEQQMVTYESQADDDSELVHRTKRSRCEQQQDKSADTNTQNQGQRYDWKDWTVEDMSKFGAKFGRALLDRLKKSGQTKAELVNSISEWKTKYADLQSKHEDLQRQTTAEITALKQQLAEQEQEKKAQIAKAMKINSDLEIIVAAKAELDSKIADLQSETDNLKNSMPQKMEQHLANYRQSDKLTNNLKMLFAPIIWFGYSFAIDDLKKAGVNIEGIKLPHSAWNRTDGEQVYQTRYNDSRDGVDLAAKYSKKSQASHTGSSSQSKDSTNP